MCISVIDCGQPPTILNALKPLHFNTTYLSEVTYTCVPNTWFDRDVFNMTAVCGLKGYWEHVYDRCKGGSLIS